MKITRAALEELYLKYPVKVAARKCGVSKETFYKRLREAGIPLKEPKGKLEIVD